MTRDRGSAPRRALSAIVNLYWESGVGDDVPALAWFLLASLVPLALGLTALATILLGDYTRAQALAARISQVLPKDVHDQIVSLILRCNWLISRLMLFLRLPIRACEQRRRRLKRFRLSS